MNKYFIFCHGFGFDSTFWDNLRPFFANYSCVFLDLGYFGNRRVELKIPPFTQVVGVGHSLGFMKLLNFDIKFDYIIGLNSFTNFLGNDLELRRARTIELERLRENLLKSPISTLERFYQRCGASSPNKDLSDICLERLTDDLEFLKSESKFQKDSKFLILSSEDDVVVPKELVQDNFEGFRREITLKFFPNGSHALGLLSPKSVYETIEGFINA
jgi:pimeloyl-[acyl-carrier protein] methyl ester esterase